MNVNERLAIVENESKTHLRNIHEIWTHVNATNQWRNQMEGGLKSMKLLLGFVGLSNIVLLIKLLAFAK